MTAFNGSTKTPASINTVRVEDKRKQELIESLRKGKAAGPQGRENRRWERFAYDADNILVTVTHPAGNTDSYLVVPRDISVGGVSFLHGQFIHPKCRCQVALPTPGGSWFRVTGKVVRCRHREGMIHEVSVAFDERIDPSVFLQPPPPAPDQSPDKSPPSASNASSSTPPAPAPAPMSEPDRVAANAGPPGGPRVSLRKSVLLIDQIDQSRVLFGKWLRQQALTVVDAATATTAREWLGQGRVFDLAVLHLDHRPQWGWDLVRRLRASGYKVPVLAISGDGSDEARMQALAAGCNAFLAKPCSHQIILDTLHRLLAAGERAS